MKFFFYLQRATKLPPKLLIKKIIHFSKRYIYRYNNKVKSNFFTTYTNKYKKIIVPFSFLNIKTDPNTFESLKIVCDQYLRHKFDLLGSGWVLNSYYSSSFGLNDYKYDKNIEYNLRSIVTRPNQRYAVKIASLISDDYLHIDWQKDFKSGFRWDSSLFYTEQRGLGPIGSDIKVPWEIGRLQHLPQLAIFAANSKDKNKYILEYKNQILDFISSNPPCFGVQWVCTMDVGIRISNILLSYHIFRSIDDTEILTGKFTNILSNSVYDHGKFITENLEYNEHLTSNHYLSNIIGLIFVSVYLESSSEIDTWLAFSVQELVSIMKDQFNEDGSNFEASTSYHRLSTELIVYGTALTLGLNSKKLDSIKNYSSKLWKHKPKLKALKDQEYVVENNHLKLPDWFALRLRRSGHFTFDISKPNGQIVQIGDNDSGRLFRFSPNGHALSLKQAKDKYLNLNNYTSDDEIFWDEDILNHQTLLSSFEGLFNTCNYQSEYTLERSIINILSGGNKLNSAHSYINPMFDNSKNFDNLSYEIDTVLLSRKSNEQSFVKNCKFVCYPDFGLYLFKSPYFNLFVSAGPNGQKGNGGHAHNDKLSFELFSRGDNLFCDPGTYLYTAIPEERNRFRSILAHNTVIIGDDEQNSWRQGRIGLFSMKDESQCYLFNIDNTIIDVGLKYKEYFVRRKFTINPDSIILSSSCNVYFTENLNNFKYYSNGYGKYQINLN